MVADAPGWLGGRLLDVTTTAGWSLLLRAEIQQVAIGPDPGAGMLGYLRGRYRALPLD